MSRPPEVLADAEVPRTSATGERGVVALLEDLVALCVDVLAADAAVILLGDANDQLRVAAASSDVVTVEPLVLASDDNPYTVCYRTAVPVRIPDIAEVRSRWPEFVVAVERAGTSRAVHVLPLRSQGAAIGALSVFHRDCDPLRYTDLALGQALADVAAIGVHSERVARRSELLNDQLRAGFARRVMIEQAKGIVGHCTGRTTNEAFVLLRDHSHRHDVRLSDVAEQIVNGVLDPAVVVPDSTRPGRHRQPD